MITGGLGFLGHALGSQLETEGHDVRLMDIRDGAPQGADYCRGSVLSLEDCLRACEGVEIVVHGAAVHQAHSVGYGPLAAADVNVRGTINLFDAAIKTGTRRFVFLSTSKVYGDPSELPSAEHDPLAPRDVYALSKLAGEHHLRVSQPDTDIEVVFMRPFSVYGPAQNLDTGYVGMVLKSLLGERPIELPGLPDYKRDFVHIDDVTRLCATIIRTESLPGLTIVNVGSGEMASLAQLVTSASRIVGSDLPIGYRTPPAGTLTRSHANMDYAAARFGFRPSFQLAEGLADTIEWFTSAHLPRQERSAQ
ncbi:MAG: NAD-dependent epimerase/dehydratase family protein [Acidimicrobiia bacterium]|nr:NAD-dependent epimerase/dehydratase family protein [Acidimicrobiia bacterium]